MCLIPSHPTSPHSLRKSKIFACCYKTNHHHLGSLFAGGFEPSLPPELAHAQFSASCSVSHWKLPPEKMELWKVMVVDEVESVSYSKIKYCQGAGLAVGFLNTVTIVNLVIKAENNTDELMKFFCLTTFLRICCLTFLSLCWSTKSDTRDCESLKNWLFLFWSMSVFLVFHCNLTSGHLKVKCFSFHIEYKHI